MTLDEVNALSEDAFIARYADLFEHSSWVIRRAAAARPFTDIQDGLMTVVREATPDEQLALVRAHPELAGKAAIAGDLTAASAAEQASAGLDRLTPEEYAHFHALNSAYSRKFGFPFIICVRLSGKADILAAMAERIEHDRETEIATALSEIGHIVRLRLEVLP